MTAPTVAAEAMLSCLEVGGAPRYDLPARHVGSVPGYEVFFRASPAIVVHHRRLTSFSLPDPELFLVGVDRGHCISIAVDRSGVPRHAYVNINLPAHRTADGWAWEDLELDVRAVLDYRRKWMPVVLDVESFEEADLSTAQRQHALRELATVIDRILAGAFPFDPLLTPWLGLAGVLAGIPDT